MKKELCVEDIQNAVRLLKDHNPNPVPCIACGKEMYLWDRAGKPVGEEDLQGLPIICGECAGEE